MDDTLTLAEAMEDLVSAEDFLDYFAVPYDPAVVHVNRLHILQRFHDYLAKQAICLRADLVRCAVIDAQGTGAAPDVHTAALP